MLLWKCEGWDHSRNNSVHDYFLHLHWQRLRIDIAPASRTRAMTELCVLTGFPQNYATGSSPGGWWNPSLRRIFGVAWKIISVIWVRVAVTVALVFLWEWASWSSLGVPYVATAGVNLLLELIRVSNPAPCQEFGVRFCKRHKECGAQISQTLPASLSQMMLFWAYLKTVTRQN